MAKRLTEIMTIEDKGIRVEVYYSKQDNTVLAKEKAVNLLIADKNVKYSCR